MGLLSIPAASAQSAPPVVCCAGTTSQHEPRIAPAAVASLLVDLGAATTWQLAALLLSVHPDRVPCAVVHRLARTLDADPRFTSSPVPRPRSRLWHPYWACGHVSTTDARLAPTSWATWRGRFGTKDVCARALVGHLPATARRQAVDLAREQLRMWQRSRRLRLRDDGPALRVIALRAPRVRISTPVLYHHLAAVEVAVTLWPSVGHGVPLARVYADSRLAQADAQWLCAADKRPDLLLEPAGHHDRIAVEFVSREYHGTELELIRRSMDRRWILAASSRQVAARAQALLNTDIYHV
jgi:hypothetical protein